MSDFLELVQNLQLALKARSMYTSAHPRARAGLAGLRANMDRWLAAKPKLHIAAANNKVFVDGEPFEAKHMHLTALSRQFSERQISGLIFLHGVTEEELDEVLEVLALKPAKIEELGGVATVFSRKDLPHVELSQIQYKEVKEGEGGEEDHSAPATTVRNAPTAAETSAAAALAAMAAALLPPASAGGAGPETQQKAYSSAEVLAEQWRQHLTLLHAQSLVEGPFEPANLGFLGGTPSAFGMGEEFPPSQQLEGLRKALMTLPPAQLLAVVAGLDSLPPGHQGMRLGFQSLAGECFAQAGGTLIEESAQAAVGVPRQEGDLVGGGAELGGETLLEGGSRSGGGEGMLQGGGRAGGGEDLPEGGGRSGGKGPVPWEPAREAMFQTLVAAPQRQSMLSSLEGELRGKGAGQLEMARLQELIEQLAWENLSTEEKLRQALEQDRFWSLSLDQRLRFLRQLLEEGRVESLLAMLELVLDALRQENVARREMAAQTLTGVTRWFIDPGLPIEAEGPLIEGLTAHFGWEPLAHIHRSTTEALRVVAASHVAHGEPTRALDLLRDLAGLCAFQDTRQEWRDAALIRLQESLGDPENLRKVAELLHTATQEEMFRDLVPYLEAVGLPAATALVEILGEEPDRKRRARLLEAIRCLGPSALPAIHDGLNSPSWYLVRNSLNLLAEMGDAGVLEQASGCLSHPDGRVKRAAVRALWKVAGPASVPHLLAAFPQVDPETQTEILFALAQVKSAQSLQALAQFAMDHQNGEKLRAKAAETIGQIGDPRAIPLLVELVRRKGRFFTSAEPLEVRLAACRSLLALGSPDGKEALCELVAAEPWHKDRKALQQVLNSLQMV
jgi:hypothetical protein